MAVVPKLDSTKACPSKYIILRLTAPQVAPKGHVEPLTRNASIMSALNVYIYWGKPLGVVMF
jgi:hypothetical protein